MKKLLVLVISLFISISVSVMLIMMNNNNIILSSEKNLDVTSETNEVPALGGYDVLIADRGNNRLIEVTPDKKIVWEDDFTLPAPGLGADDAFFTNNGKTIISNFEEYDMIALIDYKTKKILWSYGQPGVPGSAPGFLHKPDDAYRLPNGNVIVADIANCRVIEISPSKEIVRQYGVTRHCNNSPGYLNYPNGDTPLRNGHIFITNIRGSTLIELNDTWQEVFSMNLPVHYPSDPQMTRAGNILLTDYYDPGSIVEVDRQGHIVWEFRGDSQAKLNKPSLAIELPNGNILANDDGNHRVIVVNKYTKQIIWQYGVTGMPGQGEDRLNFPDGVDIIQSRK